MFGHLDICSYVSSCGICVLDRTFLPIRHTTLGFSRQCEHADTKNTEDCYRSHEFNNICETKEIILTDT